MSATFTWKRRQHSAACADNVPLLHELVRLYEDAKEADAKAGAGGAGAAAKAGGHSKMGSAYAKAIDSLAKYPLQITSAEEAEELQGFGSFLAARVGKLLSKLGVAGAAASPSLPPSPVVAAGSPSVDPAAAAAAKPPRKRKVADEAAAASPAAAAAASRSAAAASSPAAPSPSSRPIPVLPPMSSSSSPRIPTSLTSALTAVSTPAARAPAASAPVAALPACPFGALCYRTNPSHFLEQSHPPDHPMAAVMAAGSSRSISQQIQRSKSEVIVLSEGDGSASPLVLRAAAGAASAVPPPKRAVAHSFDAADDFMEDDLAAAADDDDDDVVDLTSPPVPKMSRAASTPVAASSTAKAAAAPLLQRPSALPPLHSQSISSLAPVFIPGAASAAGAAAAAPVAKKAKVDKAYRPKANSSAFALLMGLALAKGQALTKAQVLTAAMPFFRSNADAATGSAAAAAAAAPDPATLSTSLWSGMANLLTRDLVDKSLTPILYSITSEGSKTAQACAPPGLLPRPSVLNSSMDDALPDDFLSPPPAVAAASSSSSNGTAAAAVATVAPIRTPSASPPPPVSFRRVFVPAADFDVVLLIDVRERSGRKDSTFIAEKLLKQGMLCETRALAVGDFMWIARQKRPAGSAPTASPCEVVLDCMIERKRVSDLVSSIRDGRYHEQRSRLKKSGLARISYLIEGRVAEESCVGLPLSTVESVLLSMAGVHGLMVHHTPSIDASIALLAALHRVVQEEVEAEGISIVTHEGSTVRSKQSLAFGVSLPTVSDSSHASSSFGGSGESLSSFSSRLSKSSNLLAAELFGTQLRQIRGVSAPLALAILERYPCARSLVEAYEQCASREEEEEMMQTLSRGAYQRPLGKALSLKIRTFFRSLEVDE